MGVGWGVGLVLLGGERYFEGVRRECSSLMALGWDVCWCCVWDSGGL
jgi:hypothetical protein